MKVGANPRKMAVCLDAQWLQMDAIADARKLQELWRTDRTCRQDDLAAGFVVLSRAIVLPDRDPYGATLRIEQDLLRL